MDSSMQPDAIVSWMASGVTEYEDGIYEDAPGCVYEDEEDDEPEWTEEDETQYAETFEPYPALKILNWEENR